MTPVVHSAGGETLTQAVQRTGGEVVTRVVHCARDETLTQVVQISGIEDVTQAFSEQYRLGLDPVSSAYCKKMEPRPRGIVHRK